MTSNIRKDHTPDTACADPEGDRGSRPPLKNHKNIGSLSNTGPDSSENDKATKPAFNVRPSSARQRNTILMAFYRRADAGLLIVVFGSSHHQKTLSKLDPL